VESLYLKAMFSCMTYSYQSCSLSLKPKNTDNGS
jgi:hypothetical protein